MAGASPSRGPLGRGWPDLCLARRGEIIFAELKVDGGAMTPAQLEVARHLGTHVWRPADLSEPLDNSVIYQALR